MKQLGHDWEMQKSGKTWRSNTSLAWGMVQTAGQGLTSAQDLNIAQQLLGVAGTAYPTLTTNGVYIGLSNTQITTTKLLANFTEWVVGSDTTYARVNIPITGWTLTAFVALTGVIYNNTAQYQFAAVATTAQTLQSVGFFSALTAGTLCWFFDITSVAVAVGIIVQFNALTDIQLTVL